MNQAKLGALSLARRGECHPDLQRLIDEVVRTVPFDVTILCGHRGYAEQERCFIAGTSKVHWPKSKHNSHPSRAFDMAPYPVRWDGPGAREKFLELRAHVRVCADRLGIKIRHISWDLPHTELAQ
jgi:peptidoglycan L-alanyl-D-glutamate endopeptidase CwlK